MEKKQKRMTIAESNAWISRALATFAACQHFEVEAPFFSYPGFTLLLMTAGPRGVGEMCRVFVELAQPRLKVAESERIEKERTKA